MQVFISNIKMKLTISVTLAKDQMLQLAYDRWYSDVEVLTVENADGTRSMVEQPNTQTPQEYLQTMYKDLVVSDIVNTIIGYKSRPDEEYDLEEEQTKRQEIEGVVTTSIR